MAKQQVKVDFTDAKELGPLDENIPYLFAIEGFKLGVGPSGDPKVDVRARVVEPEGINQMVFDSINLVNPNTKSRLLNILAAIGKWGTKEELRQRSDFTLPSEEEILGEPFGAWVRTRSGQGQYPDRSEFRKLMTVEEYRQLVEEPGY